MKAPKELLKKALKHKGKAIHFELHIPIASGSIKENEAEEGMAHEKSEGASKERSEHKKMKPKSRGKKSKRK